MTQITKIQAYKNSDGFVTEDRDLAVKREKILNEIEELQEQANYGARNSLQIQGLRSQVDLMKLSKNKQQYYESLANG